MTDHSLHALGLLDAPAEEAYDKFTSLASDILDAPVSLVSLIDTDGDRQFFKSATGLPEPWAQRRQTPLSHSFCKHVCDTGRPLIVTDAREDPRVDGNLAIRDLGVIAYLGVPVRDPSYKAIGSFCVIDTKPRAWSDRNLSILRKIGACVTDRIRLRGALIETDAALETARHAAEARDFFFAHISHELRTPLNGIIGAGELLDQAVEGAAQRELVGAVRAGSDILLRQLNDLLDFARVKGGNLHLDPRPFVPRDLVADTIAIHRPTAAQKGIALNVEMSGPCDTSWVADDHRLGQLFGNLLSNAVKFTQAGSVTVELTLTEAGKMRLVVSDTGIGISATAQETLFDPYVQASASTPRKFGGTGLGMAIVKQLVDAMGGTVALRSRLGEGTVFTVEIPLRPVASPEDRAPVTVREAEPVFAGKRVLLAEDNGLSRLVVSELLERLGAVVTAVPDGKEAAEKLAGGGFDIAFFDLQMPGLDGTSAMKQGKAACRLAGVSACDVVAMSAETASTGAARCRDDGFADYLEKPVKTASLVALSTRLTLPPTE